MTDLRIVVPAAAAWVAALVVLPVPRLMIPVAAACWAVAIVTLVVARIRGRTVLVVIGVSAAAMALVASAAAAAFDARHPLSASMHSAQEATVVTTETATKTSTHFAATLTSLGGRQVSVPVLVFGAAPDTRTEIGTTLRVAATTQATAPSDEVSYLLFARGSARLMAAPPWYLRWADDLRAGLAGEARSLPGVGGQLLPGLAIGDTAAVSPALNQAMKTSSLS